MAIVSTKAIVISSLKYSDSSLIVRCYTEEYGLKSYLLRGVLKSKKGNLKAAYFQPLTQLKIVASHKSKTTLHSIKEVHVSNPYTSIHTNIVKQSIVLFLSEVLSSCIKEEEENNLLYEYLETAFLWLDTHDTISNFHLLFLLNLTRFLGFYPDTSEADKEGFNLLEGNFTNEINSREVVSGSNFNEFKKLLGINFDTLENVSLNKAERHVILQIIIRYFELHLDGFKNPKSITILKAIFS